MAVVLVALLLLRFQGANPIEEGSHILRGDVPQPFANFLGAVEISPSLVESLPNASPQLGVE